MKTHKQRNEYRHPKTKNYATKKSAYDRQYDALERKLEREGCPQNVKRELLNKLEDRESRKSEYYNQQKAIKDARYDSGVARFMKGQGRPGWNAENS